MVMTATVVMVVMMLAMVFSPVAASVVPVVVMPDLGGNADAA